MNLYELLRGNGNLNFDEVMGPDLYERTEQKRLAVIKWGIITLLAGAITGIYLFTDSFVEVTGEVIFTKIMLAGLSLLLVLTTWQKIKEWHNHFVCCAINLCFRPD